MNALLHTAMKRVCYEVKTSRADFLYEVKHPLKHRIGMRYSDEFYFVTSAGLVNPAEVPAECGLVEVGFVTCAEWKQLIGRHAGFFNYDPEPRTFCTVTIPRGLAGHSWSDVAVARRHAQAPAPGLLRDRALNIQPPLLHFRQCISDFRIFVVAHTSD